MSALSRRLATLLWVLTLLIPAGARAQAVPAQVHFNDILKQELVPGAAGLSALALALEFSLLDEGGQLITSTEPVSATLQLGEGGQPYPGILQAASAPWSIVMVIDASRTLTGFTASAAFKTARDALADSLEQAPSDSNLAVLSFGNQPTTVVDFTQDQELVQESLRNRIRAFSDQSSCLYDGVYEAVNKLSGAAGRRAVLVFTASADTCGRRPLSDVVELAQRNHIQIYGVGLRGYPINEEILNGLTEPTGGVTALRVEDDLIFAFQNALSILGKQWQVRTTLYPSAGLQTAYLNVTLADGSSVLSGPIEFVSDQNYVQPPEIAFRGQVRSTSTGLSFNLDLVSPDLISNLIVKVIDPATGDSRDTRTLDVAGDAYEFPTSGLEVGVKYLLRVEAVDSLGQLLDDASLEFTYQPPVATLAITVEQPTDEQPAITILVTSTNLESAVRYKAWLISGDQEGDGQPLPGTEVEAPAAVPLIIPIPVESLTDGVYQAMVQALNAEGTSVAPTASSEKFSYRRPTFLDFLRSLNQTNLITLLASVVCVAGFTLAAVAGGILVLRRSARPKQVALVLPERKISAPAPMPAESRLDRPTRPPPSESFDTSLGSQRQSSPSVSFSPPSQPLNPPSQPLSPPSQPLSPARSPAEPMPKACLISQAPADLQFTAAIVRAPFSLGRREGNDLVVRVGNRSGVSGRHATVTFAGGRFYLQDDFSSFGTRVNDERLQPGIPKPLDDGAIIALGPSVKIEFSLTKCG